MIKSILTITTVLLSTIAFAQEQGNYIIVINNDTLQLDLDSERQYKTKSGERLSIQLSQSDILTYSDDMISFKHDKSISVSNTVIEEGIEQCVALESTGNGFIVQKYSSFNPSMLTQMMMNEITKESVSYGYTKTEKPFKKKLVSGETIEGIQAIMTYKGENEYYTVATYGGKDEGIIVVTILVSEGFKGREIIELFLETLSIH
ncbi:hypothetical protein [Brumimicrobium sp.]|uniref:hypothetical protein n=1 Tax=Brumimicrobium sp. TaxID=2029867 RepID=UPI003A939D5E